MVEIRREVLRVRNRTWLALAAVINLALDDRKRCMLIRFSYDIGLAPPQARTELGARHGILGVIDGMVGITEEDFIEDYAVRLV